MDIYANKINPENYPNFKTRYAKAVTRTRLNNKIHFVSLRGFEKEPTQNGFILKNIKETLDLYTKKYDLCTIIWPIYTTMFADNFNELVDEIKKRNLFLYDFWGYVPGSYPQKDDIWGEYQPPNKSLELLYNELGDNFIGFDNGEQDGRYIGSYSKLMCPATSNRQELYKNFQSFFEKLGNHLNNDISLLSSLNFLHYFAKEGNTIILNAETAQALPNANMWFSYIRGAGKQYGLLWAGNASVWNRWGWKNYDTESNSNPYEECGINCGTSLSLLKRLLYTEYMYNCDILGFEGGWLHPSNKLTPIGTLQESIKKFVDKHSYPGVLYTPVCLYLDFFNGFAPPRHLYTKDVYRVWGNNPYCLGDYQIHTLFSKLFPHYEDAGFYRNELGFLTETPYGDIMDVILSDTSKEILEMYNLVLAFGNGQLDYESKIKLLHYINKGGHVITSIDKIINDANLSVYGILKINDLVTYTNHDILYKDKILKEKPFEIYNVQLCENTKIIAKTIDNKPLIIETNYGNGKTSVILTPSGLRKKDESNHNININNNENESIPNPYEFIKTVDQYLNDCFNDLAIVKVNNPNLQYSINVLNNNEFILLVSNNNYIPLSFDILLNSKLDSDDVELDIEQLEIKDITPDTPGYTPKDKYISTNKVCNITGKYKIDSLDIHLYKIKTNKPVVNIKPQNKVQKPTFDNLYLRFQNQKLTMKDLFLDIPSFNNYFKGIKIDAKYLEKYDVNYIEKEAEFLKRQKIDIIVDFSSIINHYPDLSFLRNIEGRTEESLNRIKNILYKASIYHCNKVILTIHRNAENHVTLEEAIENIMLTLKEISQISHKYNITLYLQNGKSLKQFSTMAQTEDTIKFVTNEYKFAYNLCHGIASNEDINKSIKKYKPSSLLLSFPYKDMFGQFSDQHLPIYKDKNVIQTLDKEILKTLDFICLDAVYDNYDNIFRDLNTLNLL